MHARRALLPLACSHYRLPPAASNGVLNRQISRHGGSELLLLALMLLFHPATWQLIGALYGRLSLFANCLILPGVSLMTVSMHWWQRRGGWGVGLRTSYWLGICVCVRCMGAGQGRATGPPGWWSGINSLSPDSLTHPPTHPSTQPTH